MTDDNSANRWIISFGAFRVTKARRLVEKEGVPVHVGSRAFDVLAHLLEHAGEVVSNRALLDTAWPDTTVEEGSVRVQVTMLRQALGGHGTNYIVNVPGRGYCFVAPVKRMSDAAPRVPNPQEFAQLPPALSLIARDDSVAEVSELLSKNRIVTVVGPGGIGKTSVAIAAANLFARTKRTRICFVELGAVVDPNRVADTFAVALGLPVRGDDILVAIVGVLETGPTLVVVDGCEHLIDAAALLIVKIAAATTTATFLVTSREGLRVEFERIFPLAALASPPVEKLEATEVLFYPAAQLFLERAGLKNELVIPDHIARICARLDGLALAIEMAAGQAQFFGIEKLTQMMEGGLHLAWPGRRTAPPRHQTLAATLEWSYRLLSDEEKRILRTLSVFSGNFDLEDVVVIAGNGVPSLEVSHVLAQLVLKSLVSVSKGARYRLLDTTKVFARALLDENGDLNTVRRLHARLFLQGLKDQFDAERGEKLSRDNIEDVRAAIAWALQNDAVLAVDLVVASFPFLRNFNLSREAGGYASDVLMLADKQGSDFQRELDDQLGHVRALVFSSEFGEEFGKTWAHVQQRAKHEKLDRQLVATHSLWARNNMKGDVQASWKCAQEFRRDAKGTAWTGIADWMEGVASTYLGNYASAHAPLRRAASENRAAAISVQRQNLPYDCRAVGLSSLALNCLFEGRAAHAEDLIGEAVSQSRTDGLDVAMGMAEHMGALTFGFIGNSDGVRALAESLAQRSKERSLTNLYHGARGYLSAIEARQGSDTALDELAERSHELERQGIDMYATYLSAERLRISIERARRGERMAALAPLDIEQPRIGPWYFSEMYRLNGQLAALEGRPDAEDLMRKGLDIARSQRSPFWELRVANDLAELWIAGGRRDQAFSMLVDIIPKLAANLDLRRARGLLSK